MTMTTKPIAVWCCVDPRGEVIITSARSNEEASIAAFNFVTPWDELKQCGYECKRFILSEAEEES